MNIEKLGIHGFASLASTKGGGFLSYLLTFALVGLAFAVRLLIAPVSAGLQYLTFFPAVTLACIVGGYRRGLFATAMGLVLATFIFTPPYFSFSFTVLTASLWSNLVFLADGLIVSFSIETMHRFRRRSEAVLEETVETKRRVQDLNEELRRRVLESERHGLELRRFEAIVASTDDAVISKSLEGTIQSWNAAAERLFGYSEEEVIGKPMTIFFPPDRLDEEAAILKRISQGERIEHFRTVRVHKSGSLVEVSATISPVRDASGRVVGASKIARDIGEVMRYEREREESSKQLESQLAEITMLKNSLQEQAIRDPLTCLFNRRYLVETLPRELARCLREGQDLSLVMVDIDHFKRTNDTYGHQAGDEVLRVVARLLSESGRGSDLQCRFGGEEFVLVMPGMSTAQARERMEGLQMVLAGSPIANGDSLISITFSAGIAAAPANGQDMDALIKCADEALYQSKSAGRNRVTCFGTAPIIDIPAIFAP